ncbi:energy-coupling factor transporter transmembrane component T [Paenibacillus sp. L3-i20]|uniref:energy-coupling factor transporter transmembrane component T n=1 Tax=Paenibacillus sp. L3-i20 TaxID=2905833 RepID=UPI001EE0A359|nr:energy-coupling factor transporter transmembrane component T [Paenibacillus sp. L3-i20]GKU76205.1 cobalt transporter [Paenibacillus sp. L3-i20]
MKRDSFSSYHPVVNIIYFALVLMFSMVFMHLYMQGIALISAVLYAVLLNGRRAIRFNLVYMLPLLLVMAVLNPVFNHAGVTILFYLKNGNPITLESILFGAAAACMFVTVLIWFSCYNAVMTSDKFIYLFGKIMPALSLILSMVLRFVPRYIAQLKVISYAQKSIGRDVSQGSLLNRARQGLTILSIMTTWALENAIETADSMKSRGYGLPNRTSFSTYRFVRRDQIIAIIMTSLSAVIIFGAIRGYIEMRFFPSIKAAEVTPISLIIYFAYFLLCMLPVIIHLLEEIKWRSLQSKS